jgi:hypothetical protein
MGGKLSALSPGFDRGRDGWSAPEPTAGKLTVLSAGPPPPVPVPVPVLGGLLGWLAAAAPPPQVPAARGMLDWLAAAGPLGAGVALAPAGGTARKESVISQGGTPVFGRALPSSDLPSSDLPASGFAPSGLAASAVVAPGFAAPGPAVGGSVAPVPGWPSFAGPGPFAGLSPWGKAGAGGLPPDGPVPIVPALQAAVAAAPGSVGGLIARGKGPRSDWPASGRLGPVAGLGAGGNGDWLAPALGQF